MSAAVKLQALPHSGAENPAGWKSSDDKSTQPSSVGSGIIAGGGGIAPGRGVFTLAWNPEAVLPSALQAWTPAITCHYMPFGDARRVE